MEGDEQQSAEDQQEEPSEDPAGDQTDDEETSSGADAPPSPKGKAFGEQDELTENNQQDEPDDEQQEKSADEQQEQPEEDQQQDEEQQPTDDQQDEPNDEQSAVENQPAEESQPVTVVFNTVPETAVIAVYAAADGATEDEEKAEPIPAQEDGSFALLPGDYTYAATAEGYVSVETIPFTIETSERSITISVTLDPIETEPELKSEPEPESDPDPLLFDQSATVDGVVVTVRAEAGAFPNDAELSVMRVPVHTRAYQDADAAVDELRDEDQNVTASYTFDIKVIDPITKEEIQPADGYTVEVSFALAEAADENLEASVYHVTQEEATGELTAEKLDADVDAEGETVTATTDGFSIYMVEFSSDDAEAQSGELNGATLVSGNDEWKNLQALFQKGGSIQLGQSYLDSDNDGPLVVPSGVTVTLDLNGYTIDRGLTENTAVVGKGNVITVDGTLNLVDSVGGGMITGGYNKSGNPSVGRGGGVFLGSGNVITVNGALNLVDSVGGGTITGGRNNDNGGGVSVMSGGALLLDGVTITGNKADSPGGSYACGGGVGLSYDVTSSKDATFTMLGGTISGNSAYMGGGVYGFAADIDLKGGTIGGDADADANTARESGGGVYAQAGKLSLSDSARIAGNIATNKHGGVYMEKCQLTVSGAPQVKDNKADNQVSNISVPDGASIAVAGAMADGASVGVTMATPGAITTGYGFKDGGSNAGMYPAKYFTSDDASWTVGLKDDEAALLSPWNALQSELSYLPGDPCTIKLDSDIAAGPDDAALEVPEGRNITLDLNGHVLNRNMADPAQNGNVITVKGTLTVKDSDPRAAHSPAIKYHEYDNDKGKDVTVTGGVITGGRNTSGGNQGSGYGGGVFVGGEFDLEGGSICGNSTQNEGDDLSGFGGGVYVQGTFNMKGGAIVGNSASDSGGYRTGNGGGVFAWGKFNFSDGLIAGNTSSNDGGGTAGNGSGVFVSGTLNMTGGTIRANKATDGGGGVYVNAYNYEPGNFTMTGGTITGNIANGNGGGVYHDTGTHDFTLDGGTITKNSAYKGGGIYMNSPSNVHMKSGEISYNNAGDCGGGVYVDQRGEDYDTVFYLEGGTIDGSHAQTNGGGVYLFAYYDRLERSGGSIVNNRADSWGGGVFGGGPYTQINLSGGIIRDNTAGDNGGGVGFIGGSVTLSGKVDISGNKKGRDTNTVDNNVWLRKYSNTLAITIGGKLENTTPIGIYIDPEYLSQANATTLTSGYRDNMGTENPEKYFSLDNDGYVVGWNRDMTEAAFGLPMKYTSQGYTGVCDGKPHSISVKPELSDATVEYRTDETKDFQADNPQFTEVCEQVVYFRITADSHITCFGNETVKLTASEEEPTPSTDPDYTLLAKMTATKKSTALKLEWTRAKGAAGYDVFFRRCKGNKKMKLWKSYENPDIRSCEITGLKKHESYRACVKAWKRDESGEKVYIGKASPTVHAITGNVSFRERRCNATKVKPKVKSLKLTVGKSKKIKASVTRTSWFYKPLDHIKPALRYFSSDRNVATVSKSGKVRAKGKGACKIYIMANNGVRGSVKVTVK